MENRTVVRATELSGRAVIDLDCAQKIGKVDKIVIDPNGRRVAAFLISRGTALQGESPHVMVPASSVHAIGPDALTIHYSSTVTDEATRFDELPKASDLIGRKVVSEDGRMLGRVDDVLISREDGRILGYTLGSHDVLDMVNKLGQLFRGERKAHVPYLRADAYLRTGDALIIAPEGAVSEDWHPEPPMAREWPQPLTDRRGLEPGTVAPGSSIRRAD
jgi:sporulation protein YlmC with PRC-barrel domain